MGTHFGRVGAMTSGRVPFDAKAAAENTEIVANMAKLPWAAFGAGTDKGSIPTRVKPEIWTDAAKFKEAGDKLQAESVKLAAAGKTQAAAPAARLCTKRRLGKALAREEAVEWGMAI